MRTVDIPGGTAVLRDRSELTVRQKRAIEKALIHIAPALPKMMEIKQRADAAMSGEDGQERAGVQEQDAQSQPALSDEEIDNSYALQNATIIAYLHSWSLPDPIPADIEDMPADVYEALAGHCAGLQEEPSGFEPSPEPDERPTGP